MAPQNIQVLVPRTREYIAFRDRGDLALVNKLRLLGRERVLDRAGGASEVKVLKISHLKIWKKGMLVI